MAVPTAQRLELARRVVELRRQGWKYRRIAEELGISLSYSRNLALDPDGAKAAARKDSYRRPCPYCGRLMSGSNGRSGTPDRCEVCAAARVGMETFWTTDQVITTFRYFYEQTGRTPTTTDVGLSPSKAAKLSAGRAAEVAALDVALPHPTRVSELFGSWRAAVLAAGLTPAPWGTAARRGPDARARILALLRELGPHTLAELSAATGLHKTHTSRVTLALYRDGLLDRTAARSGFGGQSPYRYSARNAAGS